ncbi:SDR family oxidoreductase [Streptomyces sp. NPDC001260]|uniref:SDR family oxidoreductase n=1 Tax=Streptomyces sp. NPDC001260 TaxID=3364551 RepID=UPI0036A3F3B3
MASGGSVVGREREVGELDGLVASAEGRALVLRGEPGVGKSALLDVAAARAAGLGQRVVRAAGVEAEAGLAFAGLHQLLHPLLADADALAPATRAAFDIVFGRSTGESPLPDAGDGSVTTVGSVNATLPDPLVIDHSAGKAALVAFSKALSKEVGPKGIRVNTVSPGPVETELWLGGGGVARTVSAAAGIAPDDVVAQASKATVTGRFSKPAEIADLVLFLAGDRSRNITGSDLVIDGGFIPTW